MLKFLESEEVITLLSDLHGVISPIYEVYSSKRTNYLDFDAFMRFCTDFSVFPDVINKSDGYRIFMNLAFPHEAIVPGGGIGSISNTDSSHFGGGSRIDTKQSTILFSNKKASIQ